MGVEIVAATVSHRPVLARLLELYHHDFSEFDGRDVDSRGPYCYEYLDNYWDDEHRHPFLIRVDGKWAGFALARAGDPHDMAEFFVLRKYRRQGVGRLVTLDLFHRFQGHWTVRQQRSNPIATAFWRAVIPCSYEEHEAANELVQEFVVRAGQP
jgi:predicted acetyltransferase